jgi:hypothetical protein
MPPAPLPQPKSRQPFPVHKWAAVELRAMDMAVNYWGSHIISFPTRSPLSETGSLSACPDLKHGLIRRYLVGSPFGLGGDRCLVVELPRIRVAFALEICGLSGTATEEANRWLSPIRWMGGDRFSCCKLRGWYTQA